MVLPQSNSISIANRSRRCAAFTLVEGAIALGLLGIISVALFSGFTAGFFRMQLARENQRATQIILEKAETIRLYSWDQINTPGFISSSFTNYYDEQALDEENKGVMYVGQLLVRDTDLGTTYSGDIKEVIVQVTWQTGSLERQRVFRTFVSSYGLQKYMY